MDRYQRCTQGQEFYSGIYNADIGVDVALPGGVWEIIFTTPAGIIIRMPAAIKSIGSIEGTTDETPQIYWKNEDIDFLNEIGHWTWSVAGVKDNLHIGSGQRDSFWVV